MKNISKGRKSATTTAVLSSDGTTTKGYNLFNVEPGQGTTQQHPQKQQTHQASQLFAIDYILVRLHEEVKALQTALEQERAERERLEGVLSTIKRQIDGQSPKSECLPVLLPALF